MDYNEWLVSIYDKYKEEYNKKYPEQKISMRLKDMPLKNKLKIVYIIIMFIIGVAIFIYALKNNSVQATFISIIVFFLAPLLVIYTNEIKLGKFRSHIDMLYIILVQESLNNKTQLNILTKETGGMLYRVRTTDMDTVIKLVTSLLGAAGVTYLFSKVTSEIISVIIFLIVIVIAFIYIVYSIVLIMPNNRLERKKRFHQLLKILLIYIENEEFCKSVVERNSKNEANIS